MITSVGRRRKPRGGMLFAYAPEFLHCVDYEGDYAENGEDTGHTLSEQENSFSHGDSSLLHKELQNDAARDDGGNLTGDVCADGIHEQMVLLVGLDAELFDDSGGHGER